MIRSYEKAASKILVKSTHRAPPGADAIKEFTPSLQVPYLGV